MRAAITGAIILTAAMSGAGAESPVESRGVVGCESLVALRVLMAEAPDASAAAPRLAAHPGCRLVAKARVGAVERRAMIGGAPFECITIEGEGACAWILP